MVSEILTEIAHEISHEPATFVAEVVQFGVLLLLVWFVGFGVGRRRGFVANLLAERGTRIQAKLEEARGSGEVLATAQKDATAMERAARKEARETLAMAKADAEKLMAEAAREADTEAAELLERARQTVENERREMIAEAREALIDLVAQATRAVLNERLTVAEQRKSIETAVLAALPCTSESHGEAGEGDAQAVIETAGTAR